MSDDIEGYCRLCAEPRRISEMLSPDKDIAINAKVITKLSWINIDISTTNGLPNTICYPCLELLERTWSFLNNVRSAQEKLIALFLSGAKDNAYQIELGNKDYNHRIPGKPVDENWQIFEELKREIKIENLHENVPTLYPADTVVISEGSQLGIKLELPSHGHDDVIIDSNDDFDRLSTDSDVPLLKKGVKRKRGRPKFKKSKDRDSKENFTGAKPTWDNLACMCATCDADFDSILSLQLHSLQTHDCCCIFKCIQCSKVFPAYRSFIRHMRTHNHALRRCCEFCNKLFMYQPALSSHKAKYHKTVYKTKCCNCGANFDTVEELEDHNKLFNKITKLRRIPNRNKSEDLIDYKCDQCSKVFKSRANLHQHKQLHTERTKEFACHICGKMFYTKGTLGTHLVVHEEKRPFKCIHCPMAFRAKGNLISHLSLHSGLKPFICEQCGKSFRAKRHLVSHSIVHTDLRPYVCDYCNKSFRFKTRLNLHLRQHTGVRPYKCLYCQRDFTNGSNYKKHMKRRHDMDTTTRPVPKIINKKEITTISETIAQ